jgi:hypothetical protein
MAVDWDRCTELTPLTLDPGDLPGVAFALPSHITDPDHPQRSVTQLCILYLPDPNRYLSDAAEREIRGIKYPLSRDDLDQTHWKPFDPAEVGTASGPGSHGWVEGRRLVPSLKIFGFVFMIAFITGVSYWFRSRLGEDRTTSTPETKPSTKRESGATKWRETKEALRGILREPWATRIRSTDEVPTEEAALLNGFARLFRRPLLAGIRDEDELNKLLGSRELADNNPLTGFLYRLPARLPQVAEVEVGRDWQNEGPKFLSELSSSLQERGILLKTNYSDIAESTREALDYEVFFMHWKKSHPDSSLDMFCSDKEKEPFYRWVDGVRMLLHDRYL